MSDLGEWGSATFRGGTLDGLRLVRPREPENIVIRDSAPGAALLALPALVFVFGLLWAAGCLR